MIDAVGNPQSILLLGGTSEIGLAIVREFATDRPMRVVLAARPSERLDAARGELEGLGCAVETLDFDAKALDTHADVIRKAFAGGDIDVAIVAFGLLGDNEQAWQDRRGHAVELAQVNYTAPVSVGVALAERLREQGHGSIVATLVGGRRAGAAVELRLRLHEGRVRRVLHRAHRGAAAVRDRRDDRPARIRAHEDDRGPEGRPAGHDPGQAVADVVVDAVRNRQGAGLGARADAVRDERAAPRAPPDLPQAADLADQTSTR